MASSENVTIVRSPIRINDSIIDGGRISVIQSSKQRLLILVILNSWDLPPSMALPSTALLTLVPLSSTMMPSSTGPILEGFSPLKELDMASYTSGGTISQS
jgi:hypothetical protein